MKPPTPLPWILRARRCLAGWLVLGGLLLAGGAGSAAEAEARPVVFRAGFMDHHFATVNRADAEAALKVFARSLGQRNGYDVDPRIRVYESDRNFEADIRSGAVNLIVTDAWNYLSMDIEEAAPPMFVAADRDGVAKRYLVLVREGSAFAGLADLKGATFSAYHASNASLGQEWLRIVLAEAGFEPPATFFGSYEVVTKPTAGVLPVFFGKRQACLVDQTGYGLVTEMNPQVGRNLRTIATSEPMVSGVICLTRKGWESEDFRQLAERSLARLHEEPSGQQLLTLFKATRLLPYEPAQFDTVRKLHARAHRRPSSP